MPSSPSVCSTIMSRFSEGLRRGVGLGREALAPRAIRLSSRSTRPVGDCSLADRDAFTSTVDDMWFSTLVRQVTRGGGTVPNGVDRFSCTERWCDK